MKSVNQFLLTLVTASALTACGGGGGGDSTTGGGGSTNISLPADAITLNEQNAVTVAESSLAYIDMTTSAFGVDAQTVPPMSQVVNTVKGMTFNNERRNYSIATGFEETWPCSGGGSATDTWTETDTSWSGTITFNDCNEGGVLLNGSLSYNENWNDSTADYSGSASGTLTVTFNSDSFTMALNISDSGNDNTGSFATTISYSVSGSSVGGWMVSTLETIRGTDPTFTDPTIESGALLIEGAANTKVRVTVTAPNYARVDLDSGDGNWVEQNFITL